MKQISYKRHRFPAEVIQHAVWLYFRFTLSFRNVEDLLAERGLDISYEGIRYWVLKFEAQYARRINCRRPRPNCQWHLDEVCSMSCMPARQDMQTGRHTFLHRSWGPLEPFDNSFSELLKKKGAYSHLISDHYHYWEDRGATYHTRYNSFDFIRGQGSDPWKGLLDSPLDRIRES